MIDTYRYISCDDRLDNRYSYDLDTKLPGRQPIGFNLGMAVRMYASAINPTKMNQLCSHISMVSPPFKSVYKNNTSLRSMICDFSKEPLRKFWIECTKACRLSPKYASNITFKKKL